MVAHQIREQGAGAYSQHGGLRNWTFARNAATKQFPEAEIVQLCRTGKGLFYLIGSEDEALVIDPALSPGINEQQAKRRGWMITGVFDIHVHADHLSRVQWRTDRTGAFPAGPGASVLSPPLPRRWGRSCSRKSQAHGPHTPEHMPERWSVRRCTQSKRIWGLFNGRKSSSSINLRKTCRRRLRTQRRLSRPTRPVGSFQPIENRTP